MKKIYFVSSVAMLILLLVGCMKKDIEVKNPSEFNRPLNLAAPIFNSNYTVEELLKSIKPVAGQLIYTDKDGLINTKIKYDLPTEGIEVVKVNDISVSYQNSISGEVTINKNVTVLVDKDVKFHEVSIEQGYMSLEFEKNASPGSYSLKFKNITLEDGSPLVIEGDMDATKTVRDESLNNSKIKFEDSPKNSFPAEMTFNSKGNTYTVKVDIKVKFTKIAEVKGYFGKKELETREEEIDIDFFGNNDFLDAFEFKTINLLVKTESKLGVPLEVNTEILKFINTEKSKEKVINMPKLNINSATYGPPLEASADSVEVAVEDALSIKPNKIKFKITTTINPEEDKSIDNFVTKTKDSLTTSVVLNLPLYFKTSTYTRSDTISFPLKSILDTSKIEFVKSLDLNFKFINGFPITITINADMLNDDGAVVGPFFDEKDETLLKSPDIDSEGKASGVATTLLPISLTKKRLSELLEKGVSKIILKSSVKTGDGEKPEFVKMYDHYRMDMKLSLEVVSGEL